MYDKQGAGAAAKFTCSTGVAQCLWQRETGCTHGLTQVAQSHRFYSFIAPNTSAKLVAAGATSLHFTPCGQHILGLTGNGHNISLWDVDSILRPPRGEVSGRRYCRVAEPWSNGAEEGTFAAAAPANGASRGPRNRSTQPVDAHSYAPIAAAFPVAPAIDFSQAVRNNLPSGSSSSSVLGKRPRASADRSWSGNASLFPYPMDVASEAMLEDTRGLLSPRSKDNDDLLYQMWKQRSQEQQAMIASWEEEQERRRRRQARIIAAAAAEANTFLPEPVNVTQPKVLRAPRLHECLNIAPPAPSTSPARAATASNSTTTNTRSTALAQGTRSQDVSLTRPRFSSSVTSGGETLVDDVCLFTQDRKFVLLISETQPEHHARATAPTPPCASTSVLMISLTNGTVVDRIQLQNERLMLRTNRAGATWSLRENTLALLLPHQQQILVLHCSSEGALVHRRTLGRFLQHDDEWVLSMFDSQEELFWADRAAAPRAEAHSSLLPERVTELVRLHNARRAADAVQAGGGAAAAEAALAGAAAAAQPSTASSLSTALSDDGLEPVTGLWQRTAAFLYKRALAGEEIGLSDLFDASYPHDPNMAEMQVLVGIVQRSTSLVDALKRMAEAPVSGQTLGGGAGNKADAAEAGMTKALRQFHRYRAELDSLFIAAVHMLEDGCLLLLLTCRKNRLMPMVLLYDWEADAVLFASALYTVKVVVCMMWYSEQLNHLHSACMWRSYMPHLHVMAQQLDTLASHTTGTSHTAGANGAVSAASPGPASSPRPSSSMSRSSTPPPTLVHRPTGVPSRSPVGKGASMPARKPIPRPASASSSSSSSAIQQRMLYVVAAARKVGPERMRQFMMWHLPGASQAMVSSPYTDPLMYRVIRQERMVHLHASRWLRFLAAKPKIEFYNLARNVETPAFELDCSMVGSTGPLVHATAPKLCLEMKFHPCLPIVISCFPMYSCFVVHYRRP